MNSSCSFSRTVESLSSTSKPVFSDSFNSESAKEAFSVSSGSKSSASGTSACSCFKGCSGPEVMFSICCVCSSKSSAASLAVSSRPAGSTAAIFSAYCAEDSPPSGETTSIGFASASDIACSSTSVTSSAVTDCAISSCSGVVISSMILSGVSLLFSFLETSGSSVASLMRINSSISATEIPASPAGSISTAWSMSNSISAGWTGFIKSSGLISPLSKAWNFSSWCSNAAVFSGISALASGVGDLP